MVDKTEKVIAPPLAAYTRVSSQGDRADEELHSHELQRAKIEAGAIAFGYEVSPEHFEDTNASGGSMDRPAFNRVMAGIKDGEFGGIVIAKLSRFARTTTGGLKAIMDIEEAGGAFVCLDPPIDTKSSTGEFILTLFLGLYQMERKNTAEIAHQIKDKKIAEGVHQSTVAPLGYDYSVAGHKLDKRTGQLLPIRGPLQPNEHESVAVGIFERRAEGMSWTRIGQWVRDQRVPGKWGQGALRRLIENEVYLGIAFCGNRRVENAHPALVRTALFHAANVQTGKRAVSLDGRNPPLLGGLIRCAHCGGAMSFQRTPSKTGRKYGNYVCKSHPECQYRTHSISTLKLEPHVLDMALDALSNVWYEGREKVQAEYDDTAMVAWEAQRERVAKEQADLDAAFEADQVSGAAYAAALDKVLAKRARIESQRPSSELGSLFLAVAGSTHVRDAFDAADAASRNRVLNTMVERIEVTAAAASENRAVESRVEVTLKSMEPGRLGLVSNEKAGRRLEEMGTINSLKAAMVKQWPDLAGNEGFAS